MDEFKMEAIDPALFGTITKVTVEKRIDDLGMEETVTTYEYADDEHFKPWLAELLCDEVD